MFKKNLKILFWLFAITFIFFLINFYFITKNFSEFYSFIPEFIGLKGEKKYLILIQNEGEKRPTGGFISSFAILKVGFLNFDFDLKDSYDIKNPQKHLIAPYPLEDIFSKDSFYKGWVFRDSNFDPNFPSSAIKTNEIYNLSTGENIFFDYIIAINFSLIGELLDITGEIETGGEKFSKDNYFYKIQFLSKNIDLHNEESLKNRKGFQKDLVKNIFKYFYKNPEKIYDLSKKIESLLDSKNILIFSRNIKFQEKILEKKWGGEFFPISSDFIHINIANIGGRKADRYMKTKYDYFLDFKDGQIPTGNLNLSIDHKGSFSLISDFYRGYLRIYLPKKIKIVDTKANFKEGFKIKNEENYTIIEGIYHLFPGEKFELNTQYEFIDLKKEEYGLSIIPQAGNEENWNIFIKSPTDYMWKNFSKDKMTLRENLAFFSGIISNDKNFRLINEKDKFAPVISWQKFIKNDLIEINFGEEISKNISKDNFEIEDMNVKEKIRDNVRIKSVRLEKNTIYLELEGITYQEKERYQIILKDIEDLAGNKALPNPMKITVVQN